MKRYAVTTSKGVVLFMSETPAPHTLIFHGFRRSPDHLGHWLSRVASPGFVMLPGHAGAPELSEISVATWAEAWREAFSVIGRPRLLLGESLGALVALGLPAERIVAVEPLLGAEHIWPQHDYMAQVRAGGGVIPEAYDALFATSYDGILDRICAPTLVIAGDQPLLPRRPLRTAPSLLTEDDFARYAAHPLVRAVRIPGGHNLMDENPDEIARQIAAFTADGA